MNITCAICQELFLPSDDIQFTPCGHFFHFVCVTNWLERSKTCPQCRNKVTERTNRRAYFNFSNSDTNVEDISLLYSKIDGLNFKILLKDKDLKTCGDDNVNLKKQTAGLRAEVKKLELEIDKQRSAIYAYKEQTKFLKEQTSDTDTAKKEVVRLTKCLQEYRNIQTLISDSQDEIDRMLSETQDKTALVTYISVMKREMDSNVQRRKELRERIKRLERELVKVKIDRENLLQHEAKCRQLEEDLMHCENEKKSLTAKLHSLKSQLSSESKMNNEDIHRFIAESPAPERLKTLKKTVVIPATPDSDVISESPSPKRAKTLKEPFILPITPDAKAMSPELTKKIENKETSPYLPVKSQGAWGFSTLGQQSNRLRPSNSNLSILSKKSRLGAPPKVGEKQKQMHYDGYGGHSKVDDYPSPILQFKPKVLKNNLMSVKLKRRKIADGNNKKIENYFVDLT